MSRPAPAPKKNFFQTALIMLIVYTGVVLFLKPGQNQQQQKPNGPALVTRADYLNQLHLFDKQGLEVSAQKLDGDYNSVIDADVKKNVITKIEGESEKIQGAVIVANAFLRGGLVMNDSNRIRLGYQFLQPYFRRDQDNPGWTTPVQVYQRNPLSKGVPVTTNGLVSLTQPEQPFVQVSTNARDLDQQIIDTLSFRNKTDLVWGFIPGGYQLIDFLVRLTGSQPYVSYAFAAFLLAFAVRGAVYPLAQKQLMFSRQMQQLTPRLTEIKKEYANNQTEIGQRTMALYKEYGINPMAGCFPAFIQMPLFLTVYQCMLHYQFQFSHGYFLWINPAFSAASHGIIAHDLGQQDYILILIYGVTMTISTMLTPVSDPTQYKQQKLMGIGISLMFTISMFLGVVPVVSGFVLYWTFTNLLATAQSFRAYRLPMPPLVKVNAPGGGVFPSKAPKGIWTKMMEDAQKYAQEKDSSGPKTISPINPSANGKSMLGGLFDSGKPTNGKPTNGKPSNGKPNNGKPNNGKPESGKPNTGQAKNNPKDGSGGDTGNKDPKYKPKKRG